MSRIESADALDADVIGSPPPASRPGFRNFRTRWWALRLDTRVIGLIGLAAAVTVVIAAISLFLGDYRMSFGEVVDAVVGRATGSADYVVRQLRMPRAAAAVLVGGALAISGAIFQGLIRNELVSPDIIGVEAGAGMVGFLWLLTTKNAAGLPVALFLGAMGTASLIYALAWKRGISPDRLILVGVGVQAVLVAVQTLLVHRVPLRDAAWASKLLIGSVNNANWGDVTLLAVGLGIMVPLALFAARPLRVIQLGDDTARSVGVPVELVRFALLALASAICALSIAVAGIILFVALMVPHTARAIAGPTSPSVIAFTGALGGILVLGADVLAQNLLGGRLPLGVVLGALGAPYFAFVFWRSGTEL